MKLQEAVISEGGRLVVPRGAALTPAVCQSVPLLPG